MISGRPAQGHRYFTYIMDSRSHTLYIGVSGELHKGVFDYRRALDRMES